MTINSREKEFRKEMEELANKMGAIILGYPPSEMLTILSILCAKFIAAASFGEAESSKILLEQVKRSVAVLLPTFDVAVREKIAELKRGSNDN